MLRRNKAHTISFCLNGRYFNDAVEKVMGRCNHIDSLLKEIQDQDDGFVDRMQKLSGLGITASEAAAAFSRVGIEIKKDEIRSILDSEAIRFDNLGQKERVVERLALECMKVKSVRTKT